MATTNREISIRIQEKFEFYLIALVFTILALSIQTAEFRQYIIADISELLGWLCLVLSGIVGLKRMEMFPVLYKNRAIIQEWELEKANLGNSTPYDRIDIAAEIESLTRSIDRAEEKLAPEVVKLRTRYAWHKRSFFAGLILLVIARATPAVHGIGLYFD